MPSGTVTELFPAAGLPDALKDRERPPCRALPGGWLGRDWDGGAEGIRSLWKDNPIGKARALEAEDKGGTCNTRVRLRLSGNGAEPAAAVALVKGGSSSGFCLQTCSPM